MSSASLSLLKGNAKAPEPQVQEPDVEGDTIDVDAMDDAELIGLVSEYGLEVPDNFADLPREEKISILKSLSEDGGEEEQAEAPAPEPEKPAKKAAAKKAAAKVTPAPAAPVDEEQAEEKPAAKAKAKAAPKKAEAAAEPEQAVEVETANTPAVSNVKHGEIVQQDELSELVFEIENMKEKAARDAVPALTNQSEFTSFKLGGVLALIQTHGWYQPYASFREYIENEHGMKYRKAMYWIAIYNSLVSSKVPWSKVKGLGWTKLKEIAQVLTEENQDMWIEMAQNNKAEDLIEIVKKTLKKPSLTGDGEAEQTNVTTITTKTFKLHDGQREVVEHALKKAREASETEVDTVALELICSDYLASPTMAERIKQAGAEKVLNLVAELFPELSITVETAGE